jgi:hypothetical protein
MLLVCQSSGHADATSAGSFALRNQNPLLQVFGLPIYQSAHLTQVGKTDYALILDLANHADAGQSSAEQFSIDGESYFFTFSIRQRTWDWLEIGVDIPFVVHADGFMDGTIRGWHDALGITNSKRLAPDNNLRFSYARDDQQLLALESPTYGIGDIQLTAGIPIRQSVDRRALITLRSSLKLPTGDSGRLLGSGAADISAGLYVAKAIEVRDRDVLLNALAGVSSLGDGDVLAELQRDAVMFGGAAASWRISHRFGLTTQVYWQDSYFRSDIFELGGKSLQLALGAYYRTRRSTLMRFAIVEDVSANATTDFALHISALFCADRQ